jgi:hypothetical protein
VATSKVSSNQEVDNIDQINCDIMLDVSSDEDETASIKYLKRNPDPSLRYWEGKKQRRHSTIRALGLRNSTE